MSLWIKSKSVTIQMKATEQYFPVVLFIMLYKVILTFESVDEALTWSVTIQMKAEKMGIFSPRQVPPTQASMKG